MLNNRVLQSWLKATGFYTGLIDGDAGPATRKAISSMVQAWLPVTAMVWSDERKRIAAEQLFLKKHSNLSLDIDGLMGHITQAAFEEWMRHDRDAVLPPTAVAHQPTTWPRQSGAPDFYGGRGSNQVQLELPYPVVYAYDRNIVKRTMSLHEKVAPSALRALEAIKAHYGTRISELGLNVWGGSLNVRKMRGGNAWSMHSWGIAIDWDPENNDLHWGRDRAKLARPEYVPFWEAWEAEGWVSLGRERNYDWMHVQAARL